MVLFIEVPLRSLGIGYVLQCLGIWRNSRVLVICLTFLLKLQLQAFQFSLLPSGLSMWEVSITIHIHIHCRLSQTNKITPKNPLIKLFSPGLEALGKACSHHSLTDILPWRKMPASIISGTLNFQDWFLKVSPIWPEKEEMIDTPHSVNCSILKLLKLA